MPYRDTRWRGGDGESGFCMSFNAKFENDWLMTAVSKPSLGVPPSLSQEPGMA